jgi:copper chaperone CopZ
MTYSYIVEGITCNGCVAKIKSRLLSNPDISSAEVSLEGQKAIISMQRHLSLDELQNTIGHDTKYKIKSDVSESSSSRASGDATLSWFATYKPLLIIAAFITAVSLLTSQGNFTAGMNHFMAGFFLVFAFFKLLDLKGFASSYAMYDVVAMKIEAWGFIYPFVELGLGLAFLTGFYPLAALWSTIIIMGVSSIGVIRSVMNKQKIRCACLGAIFNLPMSTVTIIEDLLMVAMAGGMILWT